MSGPLRILWPICADGAIVVVRRGEDWPELRRVGVDRWVRASAAWHARGAVAWSLRRWVEALAAEYKGDAAIAAGVRKWERLCIADDLRGALLGTGEALADPLREAAAAVVACFDGSSGHDLYLRAPGAEAAAAVVRLRELLERLERGEAARLAAELPRRRALVAAAKAADRCAPAGAFCRDKPRRTARTRKRR